MGNREKQKLISLLLSKQINKDLFSLEQQKSGLGLEARAGWKFVYICRIVWNRDENVSVFALMGVQGDYEMGICCQYSQGGTQSFENWLVFTLNFLTHPF